MLSIPDILLLQQVLQFSPCEIMKKEKSFSGHFAKKGSTTFTCAILTYLLNYIIEDFNDENENS